MIVRTALFILSFSFFPYLHAQRIIIKNETDRKPIADVFVYHENRTHVSHTSSDGIADLSDFPSGLIFLQHPSYYEKSVVFLGNELHVELTEKVILFHEVVISANKWEQEEHSISQQITPINKKTIAFQNPQTAADMLAGTGQVFVQKSQLGGGSPKLRGFAANSVLLVVDGVRMNNAIFRSGNLQNSINIDPNALEDTEIIFGPGSVIYGSDALGGVMTFRTINPQWASTKPTTTSGNLLMRYANTANERTTHLDLSIAKQKLTLFHSTTFTALDDLKAGTNRSKRYKGHFERKIYAKRIKGQDQLIKNDNLNIQRFSGYNLFSTINKVKARPGKKMDIEYGIYYSTTSDIPRYDNLTETIGNTDSLKFAEWHYGPQTWQMHRLTWNLYQQTNLYDQARITLAYQKFKESRNDRLFGNEHLRVRSENVNMYSIAVDLDKALKNAHLYWGTDLFHNKVTSSAHKENLKTKAILPENSRYPNGGSTFTSSAIYGSLVHNIATKLVLNTSLRLNHIHLQASTKDSTALANDAAIIDLNNASINGALGIAWHLKKEQKLSYNISTGFRAPNVDDVGKLFEVGKSIVVPNPNLKPEYIISNELAYEKKTDSFLGRINGFYSRLFNAIVDGPYTINGQRQWNELDVFAKVNADKAEIYGASLIIQSELSKSLAIEQTLGWVGGKDLTNNQPLRHTTPIFGRSSLTFKHKKLQTQCFLEYNSHRNQADIPPSENRKPYLYTNNGSPGWYTLNIKASYRLNEYVEANAGIENILDQHYRPYTSGISAPGRTLTIALRASL